MDRFPHVDEILDVSETSEKASQTTWFDLPGELRVKIIETLDSDTRYHFGLCSKLCASEVMQARNYCNSMKFDSKKDIVIILVNFHEGLKEDMMCRNSISFTRINETDCHVEWNLYYFKVKYEETLKNVDYRKVGGEYFEKLIKNCQRSLRKFTMMTTDVPFNENCIQRMPNLKTLVLATENMAHLELFLQKAVNLEHLDLKLRSKQAALNDEAARLIQQYKPKKLILQMDTPITDSQFLMMTSGVQILECVIGDITEDGYVRFIDSWREGRINENFERARVHYGNRLVGSFDFDKILDSLPMEPVDTIWDEDGRKLMFDISGDHKKKFGQYIMCIIDKEKDVYIDFKVFETEEKAALNAAQTLKLVDKEQIDELRRKMNVNSSDESYESENLDNNPVGEMLSQLLGMAIGAYGRDCGCECGCHENEEEDDDDEDDSEDSDEHCHCGCEDEDEDEDDDSEDSEDHCDCGCEDEEKDD